MNAPKYALSVIGLSLAGYVITAALSFPTLKAQEVNTTATGTGVVTQSGGELALPHREMDEAVLLRRAFLEKNLLPAVENITSTLEVQNAPVPMELKAILESKSLFRTEDDISTLEKVAERYFGPRETWKETLKNPEIYERDLKQVLLVRLRSYLSSLSKNAKDIAMYSPLPLEDIQTHASALLKRVQEQEKTENAENHFTAFQELYQQTFPPDTDLNTTQFRDDIHTLLTEINDALPFLIEAGEAPKFRAEIDDLQSSLSLISDTNTLTAWLAEFDMFADEFLLHRELAPLAVLKGDLQSVLTNLERYILELEETDIATGNTLQQVKMLQQELSLLEGGDSLHSFFQKLEEILRSFTAQDAGSLEVTPKQLPSLVP